MWPARQRLQCELCLRLLRDPVTYQCCGYNICRRHIVNELNLCPFCNQDHKNSLKAESYDNLADLKTDTNELCAKLEQFKIDYSAGIDRKLQQLRARRMESDDPVCDQLLEKLINIRRFMDTIERVVEYVGDFEVLRNQLDAFFLMRSIRIADVQQFNMKIYYEKHRVHQLIQQLADMEEKFQYISSLINIYLRN